MAAGGIRATRFEDSTIVSGDNMAGREAHRPALSYLIKADRVRGRRKASMDDE